MAPLAVSLVATPFVIRLLGSESYGVFILIGLIPVYLGFADFGMGLASTKFASESYAQGDNGTEARIVRTAACIALCVSLPIATVMFIFSENIIGLFNVPEYLHSEASLALRFASVTFVVAFLNNIFNTPQLTRLRMDLNTFVNAGFRILGIVAIPILLYFVGGIAVAVFALMIVSLMTLAGHLLVSGRLLPELIGVSVEHRAIRPMLKFGTGLVIAAFAAILLVNAEKGVLAAAVSVTALAHYSVAFTLASMMTLFSGAMIQSLLPAFSQLQGDTKRQHLNSLYSFGIRISLILAVPALVFISLFAKPFFSRWAGEEFGRESTLPFYLLAVGLAFNIVAYLPYVAIMASGRTDIFAKLYWIELVFYVVLVWFLASRYGAAGAALAWSIRVVVDAIIQFALAKRVAGVRFSGKGLFWFAPAAIIVLLPLATYFYLDELSLPLLVGAMFCFGVYVIVISKTMLEKEEITWLLQRINKKYL